MTWSLKPNLSQSHDVVGVFILIPLRCAQDIKLEKQAWDVMKASEIQPVVGKWDLTCSSSQSHYTVGSSLCTLENGQTCMLLY